MRLTRLRSAHAEEQYRIRSELRRSYEDAKGFANRLANLRQDIAARQDTSGDNFRIELDGQPLNNRGIAGELVVRRAAKLQGCLGEDVRIGRFAGFDLFLRPALNNNIKVILRGRNSYSARVTDTALGTTRSLEATVTGFRSAPRGWIATSPTPTSGPGNWKAKSARASTTRSGIKSWRDARTQSKRSSI